MDTKNREWEWGEVTTRRNPEWGISKVSEPIKKGKWNDEVLSRVFDYPYLILFSVFIDFCQVNGLIAMLSHGVAYLYCLFVENFNTSAVLPTKGDESL